MAKILDKLSSTDQEYIARNGLDSLRGVKTPSKTLGELFKRVVDVDPVQPVHHVLQVDGDNTHHEGRQKCLPLVLTFTDLTYSVKAPRKSLLRRQPTTVASGDAPTVIDKEEIAAVANTESSKTKTLLNSISGEARDGEIMAVLGASGSGKSTLIDALAGRISRESLRGTIAINGEKIDDGRLLKVISAYVRQDDLLFPMLTVEETLMFSAEFRLPRSLSKAQKKIRVQTLIDQLGLRNAAKTIIGDERHRGVSGGERRRVSIGSDIIHNPIVLFLDEPTSGLDSTSAFLVVQVLQRIAQSGSILIMSIHQPSYRIIGLLDRLIFLSRGNTVFSGAPNDLHPFFADFEHPIPDNENPTEFALDHIRGMEGSSKGTATLIEHNKKWQGKRPPRQICDYGDVSLKDAIGASISRGKLVSGGSDGAVGAASGGAEMMHSFANPFWVEFGVLTRRAFLNTRRSPELFIIRLGAVLVTGFILATIFWKLDTTPKGIQERLGFFAFAMSTMYYTCADALPVFLQERDIFMRETAYNAYRRSSYVLSNSIIAIPSLIFLSVAFASTTFFAVGLAGGLQGFGFFILIIFASFWSGSSFVTFLSGVISNVMMGYTVVVAVLAYFLLFSGFFITRDRIPAYWLWFHYISLVKYPYEAVLQNEFDDPTRCFIRGVQIFDNSPLVGLPELMKNNLLKSMSTTLGVNISPTTCLTTGIDILQQQGITDLSKWNALLVTVAWGFFFRILFYFSLLLGSKNKRS